MQVSVEKYLRELEEMIEKAPSLPMSSKVRVDANEVLDVIRDIRDHLPGEIDQARAVVADRNQILADARRQSEKIIRAAEEKARIMVNQSEITRQAQIQARDLTEQTQKKCRELRRASYEYADGKMNAVTKWLWLHIKSCDDTVDFPTNLVYNKNRQERQVKIYRRPPG